MRYTFTPLNDLDVPMQVHYYLFTSKSWSGLWALSILEKHRLRYFLPAKFLSDQALGHVYTLTHMFEH